MKQCFKHVIGLTFLMFVLISTEGESAYAQERENVDRMEYEVDCVSWVIDETCAKNIIESTLDLKEKSEGEDFLTQASTFTSLGISVASIEENETKTISWKSSQYETGLVGYVWYWTLEVTLRANSSGTGYEYESAVCSLYTVEQYWKLIAMQYRTYSCLVNDFVCYYSEASDRVNFEVNVVFDINYMTKYDTIPTFLSFKEKDTHSVLLK